jgi:tetratricopeptide (TPR) repeat protein
MANENIDLQIGQAWLSHRQGNNEAAIDQFGRILRSSPDSIDANYGLGLANHAIGNQNAAAESFQRALLITDKLEAASQEDRDRYMMLSRMIKQRLEEVKSASNAG